MLHLESDWRSLIRFTDQNGLVYFGEPLESDRSRARIWVGSSIDRLLRTQTIRNIVEVLSPYEPDNILCIASNYKGHPKNPNISGDYPIINHKSKNTVNGPYSPIVIPKVCNSVDYECELCVVIGKDAKDVLEDEALDYVLAYTIGNDVTSRDWQRTGHYSFARSFDGFMPFGPELVNSTRISDPQSLKLTTKVNGKIAQEASTSNMILPVKKLIAYMSQGTTLPAGTLIMTGSPPATREDPQQYLKVGDIVECEIEGLGKIKNQLKSH